MAYERFEDLEVWQEARRFRQEVFTLAKKFPDEEIYVLTSQIRRAAISITANIVEGYGRFHIQENIQYCRIARSSLNECLDHLYCALDCKYINQDEFDECYEFGREVERILNGYIRFLKKRKD